MIYRRVFTDTAIGDLIKFEEKIIKKEQST